MEAIWQTVSIYKPCVMAMLDLLLTIPGQGLGNAAISAVANPEQLKRFSKSWAAMAITEPNCGSDSSAITTTASKRWRPLYFKW
jgi:alkylation response protein AidB-like acyl-CoA dehydrogenase